MTPELRPLPARPRAPLDLETALEEALNDAVHGQTHGPLLARRLETVARATLYRYGISRAVVSARLVPGGVDMNIQLPPETPRVQFINIRMGRASG